MPNGIRPYVRFRGTSTSYRGRKRTTVPPKKKTNRTYIRSNAAKANSNAKKINRLYNMQWGPVQRSLQLSNSAIIVTKPRPICFDAADFTSERSMPGGASSLGCRIHQVNTTDTGILTAGNFTTANYVNDPLWSITNQNLCGDGGRYKPIYAKYTIEVTCEPYATDTYLQLDLVTQKAGFFRQLTNSTVSNSSLVLPEALVNLPGLTFENDFNPEFFKHYKRKRLYLNNLTDNYQQSGDGQNQTSSHQSGTTGKTRYFSFTVKPKYARHSFQDPDVPGHVHPEDGQAIAGTFGQYNVDPRTPFWAIISCSDPIAANPENIRVRVKRHVVWRDSNGTSSFFSR